MIRISQPSNLELQALTVLWHLGPSTVATVLEELPDGKERAYTTVLTVMQNLEKKGHVRRVKLGRAHVYQAAHPQKSVVSEAVEEFITNTFGGRLGEAVMALLASGTLTAEEKAEITRHLKNSKTLVSKKTAKKAAAPAKKAPVAKKAAAKPTKKVAKKTGRK
jgi:predicted transcriptional regulator